MIQISENNFVTALEETSRVLNLKRIYNGLWNESLQKFSRNRFELDPVLNSETDDRYGVSLIVRPSKGVKRNISDVLDEIKTAAPHQYYYPGSDLRSEERRVGKAW